MRSPGVAWQSLGTDNRAAERCRSIRRYRTRTESIALRYCTAPRLVLLRMSSQRVVFLLFVVVVVVFQSRKHAFNLAIVSTINAMRYDTRCRQTEIKKNDTKAFTS